MTNKTLQARKNQSGLPPIQRVESDLNQLIYIVIVALAICFAGCKSVKNVACAGNKQMMQQQGNYSKTFKF